jgi:hypothetical protein
MSTQYVEVQQKIGLNHLRVSHQKSFETGFGDISMQMWRDGQGHPYIQMTRGRPETKTFTMGDFLSFADKVQEMADRVREKVGEL